MFRTLPLFKTMLFLLAFSLLWSCSKDESSDAPTESSEGLSLLNSMDGTSIGEYSDSDSTGGSSTSDGGDNGGQTPEAGVITAGEWKDLDDWEYWLQIMRNPDWIKMQEYWQFFPTQRYSAIVKNNQNQVLNDAQVLLKDAQGNVIWQAHTDNSGAVELWAGLYGENREANHIEVIHNSQNFTFNDIQQIDDGKMELKVNSTISTNNYLDISVVVDATGSMGDEMEFLKVELQDVLNRVKSNNANVDLRIGTTFYRDDSDVYLVRNFPMTSQIGDMLTNIEEQAAGGGGDFPEAVEAGLSAALYENNWSESATARLMFLLLDAPPHHNQEVTGKLQQIVEDATAKGIKIIPITASGIGKETEFLMRFFAISTNGTYVFITNHSGVGGDHIEPTIGQYEVEKLNDLLVRLIGEYTEMN
ncbi:MAG: vWA domain-containing protein [Chitinophagales bacterium]